MTATIFDRETATLEPGVTLIEASAGTGKTFSLAELFLRLVLEQHIPISQILAVTYTVAATEELRDRVRRRLHEAAIGLHNGKSGDETVRRFLSRGDCKRGIEELDLTLQSFDEAQIFTIHGFCQRVLHDHAFESGTSFDSKLLTDPTPLFEEAAKDFWRLTTHAAPSIIPALMVAWEQSPTAWVKLLDRIRNHPDVALIPPPADRSLPQLTTALEEAFAALRAEWRTNNSEIKSILRTNGSLSRAQSAFSPARVEELLNHLAESCNDFERVNPVCLKALEQVTAEAIAAGTKRTGSAPLHRFFDQCSAFSRLVEALFLHLTYAFLQYAGIELPKRKARTGVVTFDDLILRLRGALKATGGDKLAAAIGAKYQAALIDEFQDTDPAQYQIFQRIFGTGKHSLFYIGDPKQAIYGFRGADVFTYLEAASKANRIFTLATNRRSEKKLVAAVNRLFQQVEHPFILPRITYHQVNSGKNDNLIPLTGLSGEAAAPLQFRFLESIRNDGTPMNQAEATGAICRAVNEDMVRLKASNARLGGEKIRFDQMAVLVRRNAQADQMQEVLRAHGIPSIVQSERSVFGSGQARELQQLLQGILEPRRERLFKAALTTSLIGFNGNQLADLDQDETARQRWLDRFAEWQTKWMDDCFIAMFRQVLVQQDARSRVIQLPAGERRLTNFLHLAELLHSAETTGRLQPDGVCAWLHRERNKERIAQDEFQLRLESDDDAVQIVTIHKCKGLEYPIVYCPFLWLPAEPSKRNELQFHDRNNQDRLTISLVGKAEASAQQQAWQTEEITSEELRMLYVAVTRAKNRCTIHLGHIKKIEESPLAYLFGRKAELREPIAAFAANSDGSAASAIVQGAPQESAISAPALTPTFAARRFAGNIDHTVMAASFSGLNAGRIELQELEPEVADEPEVVLPEQETTGDTIFDFARGARAGDFFHAVLEELDFQNGSNIESAVDRQLSYHGLARTPCRAAILAKLQELCEVELQPGMSLKAVPRSDRVAEMEFACRLNRTDPKRLREILERCPGLPSQFTANLGRLRFNPVEGYLRGFIDLFFQFNRRYYIVDWKSNWLGNQAADYDEEGMRNSMVEHNYFLQAHLYLLAADLFLQNRVKNYDYARDFGGVFYIYLRGVDPKSPRLGVYEQKPVEQAILALRELAA